MVLTLRPRLVAAALIGLLASAGASAATLYQQLPDAAGLSQQSDNSTGTPYAQTIPALGSITLETISWWGFHGQNSQGSAFDRFEVFVGGAQQTGTLTSGTDSGFAFYTLDIPDIVLNGAQTLEIWNNSLDVEWFWAGAAGTDATAYRLDGTRNGGGTVPEPASLALLGLAGLGLLASRRRMA